MDVENIMLSEISQAKTKILYYITYVWNLKNNANECICKTETEGFPGGAVVKNPPANAGNRGSSPGPGRSHMPWSN